MRKSGLVILVLVSVLFTLVLSINAVSAYREVGINYHDKTEMIQMWKDLCVAHPSTCSYEVIGKSYLGKDLYLFKVGTSTGGKVLIDGSMHGWEDSGTEFSYVFAKYILEGGDAEAKRIQKNNYMLFIPIVNMDSARRQTSRRVLDDGTAVPYGVDLNRNFCAGFGGSGSGDPNNNYEYRGPVCASESETQALRAVMQKYKPKIYLNVHMGGSQTYGVCNANSVIAKKVLAEYDAIRLAKNVSYRYPIGGACGAGMAPSDGNAFGADAWHTETLDSDHIPNTAADLIKEYWPKNYPMWAAMAHAVEVVVVNNTTNTSVVVSCVDSDGGNNTFKSGVVSGKNSSGGSYSFTDSCFVSGNVSKVKEFYCSGVNYKSTDYTCQNGCVNGSCKAAVTNTTTNTTNTSVVASCVDSDGGNNTFKVGVVSGKNSSGGSFSFSDSCFMSGNVSKVKEFYCSGVNYKSSDYVCQNGCVNGSCKAAANSTNTSTPPVITPPSPPPSTGSSSKSSKSSGGGGSKVSISCGDNVCTAGKENCSSCATDCGNCVITLYCGDNVCTAGKENCSSCNIDCGNCVETIPSQTSTLVNQNPEPRNNVVNSPQEIMGSSNIINKNRTVATSERTGLAVEENSVSSKRSGLSYLLVVLLIISAVAAFLFSKKIMYKNKHKHVDPLLHVFSFSHFLDMYPEHAKNILNYIKKAKELGHSEYLIKYNLLNGGWPEHVVNFALSEQED